MSYILDALRKSDQQRKQGGVPTLPDVAVAALSPDRSALLAYGPPVLVLILAIAMAISWVRSWPVDAAKDFGSAEKPFEGPARQALPVALPPVPAAPPVAPVTPTLRQKPVPSTALHSRNMPPRAGPASVRDEAAATAETPTVPVAPMAVADMPLAIRQQLPPMAVAVHLYSSKPRDRLASINGRTLREGDSLTPDLKLEQITPEGMIFIFRGYRFQRNAQ